MLLYALTTLVSAFLLFQVQPVIAKIILPWFGGSAAVWTACVLFFQLLLLLGYLYSHWTIRYLRPRIQTLLHMVLLGALLFGPDTLISGAAVITHLAFYCGWPNAGTAALIAKEVFAERGS
jgi:hypothetical protein